MHPKSFKYFGNQGTEIVLKTMLSCVSAFAILFLSSCSGGDDGGSTKSKTTASTAAPTSSTSSASTQTESGGAAISSSFEVEAIEEEEEVFVPEVIPTEEEPFTLTVSAADSTTSEGSTTSITAILSNPLADPLVLNIITTGTAEKDLDYTLSSEALTINPGEISASVSIQIIDDEEIESVETIALNVTGAESLHIESFESTILIEDNDVAAPTDISGMILHLSAEYGMVFDEISGDVTNWTDKTDVHTVQPIGSNIKYVAETPHLDLPGVSFDSTSAYLRVANHDALNTAAEYSAKTILMVFYTSEDVTTRQVIYEQGGGTRGLSLYIENGLLYQCVWNNKTEGGFTAWGPQCVTSPAIKSSVHFTALRFDQPGNEIAAFVGFTKVDSIPAPGKVYAHAGTIGLGNSSEGALYHDMTTTTNHPFEGYLYEYITYNNSLTDQEIAGIYNTLNPKYQFNSVKTFNLESAVTEVNEGENLTISIVASSPYEYDATFNLSASGEATSGLDFTLPSSVILPQGATRLDINIPTITDEEFEIFESLSISMSSPDGLNLANTSLNLSIKDDTGSLMSNVTAWYKPESIVSVDSWENSLNADHHIYKYQASTATISDINGHQAIQFNGDGILTIANHEEFNTVQSTSKFFILAFETGSDVTTPQVVYEEGGGSNGINLYVKDGKVVGSFWYKSGSVFRYFIETAVSPNSKYVALFYYDSISDRFLLNVNRNEIGSLSVDSKPLPSHAGKIAIGSMYNDTYFETAVSGNGHHFTGKISEFMYFNNPTKTDTEINTMIDYFCDKYAIPE